MSTSRLMRTCRTLNHEGAKHLFRYPPWIRDDVDAISLTQYAFARANVAELAYRMQWLRGLCLTTSRIPWRTHAESCQRYARTMAFFLTHFAIHAPNLVELELSDSEELFSADPALITAVGAMVRLQNLNLGNAGPQTSRMLRHSSFRLRRAEIHHFREDPGQPSVKDNPIFALYHSGDTLRSLTLGGVTFDPHHRLPCYKNMHKLTFSSSAVPPVHHLAESFPNLRVLNVQTYPKYYQLSATEREEQRQESIRRQERDGSFGTLDSYSGSILSLYVLGLTCRIPYISLRDDDSEDEPCWDVRMLHAVCARVRPAHLLLYICSVAGFVSQAEEFVQLCASAEFETVRTISLTFDIWWAAREVDLACMLERIYSAVRASSLRAVEVILDWQGFGGDCHPDDFDPGNLPPADVFLRSLDLETVADKLLEAREALNTAVVCSRAFETPEVKSQRGPDINYNDDS